MEFIAPYLTLKAGLILLGVAGFFSSLCLLVCLGRLNWSEAYIKRLEQSIKHLNNASSVWKSRTAINERRIEELYNILGAREELLVIEDVDDIDDLIEPIKEIED